MGICLASQCQYCEGGLEETMKHVFFTVPVAKVVRRFFANLAGIIVERAYRQSIIKEWWSKGGSHRLQQVYNVIPPLVCWEFWKRRTNRKHGGNTSINTMIHNIQANVHYLIRTLYPKMKIMNLA